MTNALTAKYVGIGERTLDQWRNKGATAWERSLAGEELTEREDRYMRFLLAMEEGAAQAAGEALAAVIKASREGTWQAAAWMLERRHGYVRTGVHEVRATVQATVDREALAAHLASKLGLDDDEAE